MTRLDMFVVSTGSRCGSSSYSLMPGLGAVALARGATERTLSPTAIRNLCDEVVSYVELGLTADIDTTPGIAAYLPDRAGDDNCDRAVAGLRLVHERIQTAGTAKESGIELTAVVLVVVGSSLRVIAAGPGPMCWSVREGAWRGLIPDARLRDELRVGIGSEAELNPVVLSVPIAQGDLFGVGYLCRQSAEALARFGNVDIARALAECARSPIVAYEPLAIVRCVAPVDRAD